MTIRVVLADANILYSRTLRDYFLYAADAGAIEIRWSQQVLDEMSRNLRLKLGLTEDATRRLEALMNDFIEYALVSVEAGDLATAERVEMDPADRHVLAAARSADAEVLLTQNTRHFPRVDGRARHRADERRAAPGPAHRGVAGQDPHRARATLRHSPKSEAEVLATLASIVGPGATDALRAILIVPGPGRSHD